MSAYVSIRQHTSAYVSIRKHKSAFASVIPVIADAEAASLEPKVLFSRAFVFAARLFGGRGHSCLLHLF